VDLKGIAEALSDFGRAGVVVGKKAVQSGLADERDVAAPEVWTEAVRRLHTERLQVKVADIMEETPSTKTLRLVPTGEALPPFRAGQFFTVFLEVDGTKTSRAYSASSPPTRPGYLDVTVREMPDGFVSRHLCGSAKVGDLLEVSGPGGGFYHEPLVDGDDLVFLAGGSGVTPFMSMIRESADLAAGPGMHLIYGSRTPGDVIFDSEIAELARSLSNLDVDLVMSEPPPGYEGPCGLLDADMISARVGSLDGKKFFMCGPHAMYALCLESLEELGIPRADVKQELSGPPPDVTLVAGWPEGVGADSEFTLSIEGGASLTVRAGEPLMNSMERGGVSVENLCRSGECGLCRTRLVSGEVFMPESVAMRKSDVAFGYVHPCMSYPLGDLTVRI